MSCEVERALEGEGLALGDWWTRMRAGLDEIGLEWDWDVTHCAGCAEYGLSVLGLAYESDCRTCEDCSWPYSWCGYTD